MSRRTLLNDVHWNVGHFYDTNLAIANLRVDDEEELSQEQFINLVSQKPLNLLPYRNTNTIVLLFPVLLGMNHQYPEVLESKFYDINNFRNELDLVAAIESFYTENTISLSNDELINDLRNVNFISRNRKIGGQKYLAIDQRDGFLDYVTEILPGVYYVEFEY